MWAHNNPRIKPLQITTMTTKNDTPEKIRLHIRNKNREAYDLEALKKAVPELEQHIKPNKYGAESVDFAKPEAVKLLNQALLSHYYGIKNWNFADENLCPPIPGRADYLHYIADLLTQTDFGNLPEGNKITALDIGVGANCIYPIIGVTEYGWNFIGSDIDPKSVETAKKIVETNESLTDKIEIKLQENPNAFFDGIIGENDKVDLTFCNPPFHSSSEEAEKGTQRKLKNLTGKTPQKNTLNFAGISNELIYEGGEAAFIHKMIRESKQFAENVFWFSTLVSKQGNLKGIYKLLNEMEIVQIKTIPMGTGNKSTRIIAWSYLPKAKQQEWREQRWISKNK